MSQVFKALSSGLSVLFLYVIAVFIAPIIIMLLGYTNVVFHPKLFSYSIYFIEIEETTFSTEATGFGCLLAFIIGLSIHVIVKCLFKFKKTTIVE